MIKTYTQNKGVCVFFRFKNKALIVLQKGWNCFNHISYYRRESRKHHSCVVQKGLNGAIWVELIFRRFFLLKYFHWNGNKTKCTVFSWKVTASNSWLNNQGFPPKRLKMKMSEHGHNRLGHINFRNFFSFELVKSGRNYKFS